MITLVSEQSVLMSKSKVYFERGLFANSNATKYIILLSYYYYYYEVSNNYPIPDWDQSQQMDDTHFCNLIKKIYIVLIA